MFSLVQPQSGGFFAIFIKLDETWIHHNVRLSVNRVKLTFYWDSRGIFHIEYLQKGKTINSKFEKTKMTAVFLFTNTGSRNIDVLNS